MYTYISNCALQCMRKVFHCLLKDSAFSTLSHGYFLYIHMLIIYAYVYINQQERITVNEKGMSLSIEGPYMRHPLT